MDRMSWLPYNRAYRSSGWELRVYRLNDESRVVSTRIGVVQNLTRAQRERQAHRGWTHLAVIDFDLLPDVRGEAFTHHARLTVAKAHLEGVARQKFPSLNITQEV